MHRHQTHSRPPQPQSPLPPPYPSPSPNCRTQHLSKDQPCSTAGTNPATTNSADTACRPAIRPSKPSGPNPTESLSHRAFADAHTNTNARSHQHADLPSSFYRHTRGSPPPPSPCPPSPYHPSPYHPSPYHPSPHPTSPHHPGRHNKHRPQHRTTLLLTRNRKNPASPSSPVQPEHPLRPRTLLRRRRTERVRQDNAPPPTRRTHRAPVRPSPARRVRRRRLVVIPTGSTHRLRPASAKRLGSDNRP